MATQVEIHDREALEAYLRLLGHKGKVEVKHYGYDVRLMQDTYTVTVDGKTVGFTDGDK